MTPGTQPKPGALQTAPAKPRARASKARSASAPPATPSPPTEGRRRVLIEGVKPEIDAGQFPIKRTVGERVVVEADIFTDGHDALAAVLKYRRPGNARWMEVPMAPLGNDRWRAAFTVMDLGEHVYTIEAWIDHFQSWRHDLEKKHGAGQDVSVEMVTGSRLVAEAAQRSEGEDRQLLEVWSKDLEEGGAVTLNARVRLGLDPQLKGLMTAFPDRRLATVYSKQLRVWVDPVVARFGAWYEMFPRSCSPEPGRHGTFRDCEAHLPRIAAMGFDILYLPPIHPIGRSYRKGKNNHPQAKPGEPGSPWGIGSEEGGHKAIHPSLGTLQDFQHLVSKAREWKLQIALDIAFQCSPEHPYVREHPDWFRKRADGSIQYAENPPKKYQDIYPLDFESEDWPGLWNELKSVLEFWIEQGVSIFRVDNPHTKAFPFWEWVISELNRKQPGLIFLSEAFTRPKVMYRLAKLGFTQSYNYFPWRNSAQELTEYLTEVTQTEVCQYFRPNLWPNTPDILTPYLQYGGRQAFMIRLVLAATLGASYGIYGPAFELCDHRPKAIGSEEYFDSEKYEIKHWNLNAPGNLVELISHINRIRRENPALHANDRLEFHPTDNPQILAFSKTTEALDNVILVVANVDPHHIQSGWVSLDLAILGIAPDATFQVHDLVRGERYLWRGSRNYIELNPNSLPAHVFRVRPRVTTEQDFDNYK